MSFEIASAATAYPALPRANRSDVAAGFTFLPRVGVGVHFDFAKYEIGAGLGVRIPHPLFFNRFATDETVTSPPLERQDIAVDIPVVFIPPTPKEWRVRLFAGPTYFRMTQEMVGAIEYDQLFNVLGFNAVEITSFLQQKVEGSA